MVQDFTAFRKISFQTVDVEVALAAIEYQYLKFICEATFRNSDEVLREQIRQLQIAGLPSFDEWRKQDATAVRGILSPSIEAQTIPTIAIESDDRAAETLVELQRDKTSDRTAASTPKTKAKATETKPPSNATNILLKNLSQQATAKLTSREVIEHEHEQLSALLKEGKSMDDLAALLTSNGARISASTLRNYLSAARRKAKEGNATEKKKVSVEVMPSATPERSPEAADSVTVEPAASSVSPPSEAAPPATSETVMEPTIAPPKPARGRPKAVAKSTLERETSVASPASRQPSPLDVSPVPRRRKGRL